MGGPTLSQQGERQGGVQTKSNSKLSSPKSKPIMVGNIKTQAQNQSHANCNVVKHMDKGSSAANANVSTVEEGGK